MIIAFFNVQEMKAEHEVFEELMAHTDITRRFAEKSLWGEREQAVHVNVASNHQSKNRNKKVWTE